MLALLLAALGVGAYYTIQPADEAVTGGSHVLSCIPANSKWGKMLTKQEEEKKKKSRPKTKAKISGARMTLPPGK